MRLETLYCPVHIRTFEVKFLLPIFFILSKQKLPICFREFSSEQIMLAFALISELSLQFTDARKIGIVFGAGIYRVASSMSKNLLYID